MSASSTRETRTCDGWSAATASWFSTVSCRTAKTWAHRCDTPGPPTLMQLMSRRPMTYWDRKS